MDGDAVEPGLVEVGAFVVVVVVALVAAVVVGQVRAFFASATGCS